MEISDLIVANNGLVTVTLRNCFEESVVKTASQAGQICYKATVPTADDKPLNVKDQLYAVSHHTTLEHSHFQFRIDGISVGGVTFGLHLCHPFYNTDQRSGRFCTAMFSSPNYEWIMLYLDTYYPTMSDGVKLMIREYIWDAVQIYNEYLPRAEEEAKEAFAKERPHASEAVKKNSAKIAQEQMRMFIPVLFPTALDYTIDFITLVSMWQVAWTPEMWAVTDLMRDLVIAKFPEAGFAFDPARRLNGDYGPQLDETLGLVVGEPGWKLLSDSKELDPLTVPKPELMVPTDLLHFLPEYMNNSTLSIKAEVAFSVATMGQDQRHRTFSRSEPRFTGTFYLPPLLEELNLEKKARQVFGTWKDLWLEIEIPSSLGAVLAPYGAMVTYHKEGSMNAFAHEQAKRLCLCAQEEIYEVSRQARNHLYSLGSPAVKLMIPPCYTTGKCAEGARYCCGRDLSLRGNDEKFFSRRKI